MGHCAGRTFRGFRVGLTGDHACLLMDCIMDARKHGFRLGIEALERRETPSAGVGGSLHEMVVRPRAIAFSGTGTVAYVSETTGSVTVNTRTLGTLTGTLVVTSSTSSVVEVKTGTDTVLDLSVHGRYTKGRVPHFSGTFTVSSGSEVDGIGVGGKGSVGGTVDTKTDVLDFRISGRLTE